ncbi:MAG: hypothetical protein JSW39_26050 [Desulfobacterales bacterium]|nr:MAG: hypothetical protein JSW39_26050 [Desulfobacterales bacterium]
MKKLFKAKDIQKLLGISKIRYEYLLKKLNIIPHRMARGQGKTHLYSFGNLMSFGFAHYASELGLSSRACSEIHMYLGDKCPEVFDYEMKLEPDFAFSYIYLEGKTYYRFGKYVMCPEILEEFESGHANPAERVHMYLGQETFLPESEAKDLIEKLCRAEAYLNINLGVIKERFLNELRE